MTRPAGSRRPTTRSPKAWRAEVHEAETTLRRETLHLATGLLLPVWDKLPDDHVQVIRIAADDGRSLLGREIPSASLAGARREARPRRLARDCRRTSLPRPYCAPASRCLLRGVEDLILKRSLVNGSQRLELAGFSAARLPWYKAQGCFTEIIRYQTRLFVPVDRAAEVLARLHDDKSG